MRRKYMKNLLRVLFCAALIAVFVQADYAKPKQEDYSIAFINDYEGECELKKKGESIGEAVADIYLPLYEGDTVLTEYDSRMEIVFDDATIMKLDPNSRLVIKSLKRARENKTVLELVKGRLFGIVKKIMKQEEFTVRTKLAMAAVKGTELVVETGNEDKIGVYEGAVEVSNMDMSGNVLSKVIVGKDMETTIVKRLKGPAKVKRLSRNFVKRYKELKSIRDKIKYLREMRRSGKVREFKLKRRLDRIRNLKAMKQADPKRFKKLSPQQKALINEIIKQEPYYQAQYEGVKKKERKTKSRIKTYLEEKKAGREKVPVEEETPEE